MKSKTILFALVGWLSGASFLFGQTPQQAAPPPCLPAPQPAAQPPAAQGQGQAQGAAAQPQGPRDVTVTQIAGVVAAGAKWTKVWQTGGNNADGIIADKDGSLLIAQEDNSAVVKLDSNGKASVFLSNTRRGGSLSMDRQDRLYAVLREPQPAS